MPYGKEYPLRNEYLYWKFQTISFGLVVEQFASFVESPVYSFVSHTQKLIEITVCEQSRYF